MKESAALRRVLKAVCHYAVFFLLMAFVITCCMMLFLSTMSRTMGLTLTEESIQTAAKLTFVNVVLLSLLCTVIDAVRRRSVFDRPVRRITDAAEKLMQGDFSVRIPPRQGRSGGRPEPDHRLLQCNGGGAVRHGDPANRLCCQRVP